MKQHGLRLPDVRPSDWPVGVRLASAFAAVAALVVAIALLSSVSSSHQDAASQRLAGTQRETRATMQVKFRSADFNGWQTAYAFDVIHSGAAAAADDAPSRKAFLKSAAAFRSELAAARAGVLDPAIRRELDAAHASFDSFMTLDRQVIADYRAGTATAMDRATKLVLGQEITVFQAVANHVDRAVGQIDREAATRLSASDAQRRSASRLILVATLAALLFAALLAFALTRSITRPLRCLGAAMDRLDEEDLSELESAMQQLASGDLAFAAAATTEPLPRPRSDELGRAQKTLNALIAKVGSCRDALHASRDGLSEMISEVASTATSVNDASRQMAATSMETGRASAEIADAVGDVAVGAQRQVEMIEAARGIAEEVGAVTAQSSENAQQTAAAAERARDLAGGGAEAAEAAGTAMAAARRASDEATEAIRGLSGTSAQIGGIVDTITSIAEQTNLLALNAAIEAARAGDQGRGFAVVADEVRKLAEESRAAAGSISHLIDDIRTQTSHAVRVVEDGARRTDESATTVDEARRSFERIGSAVGDVSGRIDQIAAAAEHIADSSRQMVDDMSEVAAVAEQSSASTEQVSASTQQTTASTHEIATAAGALSVSADHLESLVARFRLAA